VLNFSEKNRKRESNHGGIKGQGRKSERGNGDLKKKVWGKRTGDGRGGWKGEICNSSKKSLRELSDKARWKEENKMGQAP